MSRLPPLDPGALDPEQRRVHDDLANGPRGGVRGPFPALLRRPVLAERVAALGAVLRFDGSFPPVLFETAVLATAKAVRCELEWHAHARIAADAGVPADAIEAIRTGAEPPFEDPDQRLVHAFARELAEGHRVSDATYRAATERFGEAGVVELAAVIGYFCMVAATINAHELRFAPDAADPFPADGEVGG
jgi:4-carboxymuconolactone decarboxylase